MVAALFRMLNMALTASCFLSKCCRENNIFVISDSKHLYNGKLKMNKAFVKDDDTWQDPEIELDPRADIPAGSRNYMTPRGVRRLRDELDDLVRHSRPQLLAAINRLTREGSGRSDATYRDTRKSLQRLESRIAFLTGRLAITEEIDPLDQDGDKARFGATVSVQELEIVEVRYPRR
jgi:transcription elongation factor GreB